MRRSSETSGTAAPASSNRLWAEADYLHEILFGVGAPEQIEWQYAAALQAILRQAEGGEETRTMPISARRDIETLLEPGVDLEAMELALRRKDPLNPLTQRFRVLCYLAEARPEYFDCFVTERRRFLTGALALGLHALRSVYKIAKGTYLIRKHGLR